VLRLLSRNSDLHHFAAAAREAGDHRLDQARHHYVEPAGLRARLNAAGDQRGISSVLPVVEMDLAIIFDIGVDPTAVPEGILPAPRCAPCRRGERGRTFAPEELASPGSAKPSCGGFQRKQTAPVRRHRAKPLRQVCEYACDSPWGGLVTRR